MSNLVEIKPFDEKEFVYEQKWRCNTIQEMALPQRIKDLIMGYLSKGRIPCMLFHSTSPGTGKTTTAFAVANAIGCTRPLYVNASLDTDVANIREKVFKYASSQGLGGGLKVVILDEAERLSVNAQESLKGLIERVSRNCVFVLTTNNKNKLVAPLRSRCRVIDYEFSDDEKLEMIKALTLRTMAIIKYEGFTCEPKVLLQLVKRCFPDNRRLLGTIQDYTNIYGKIDDGILVHNQSGDFTELLRIMEERSFMRLNQWVNDYSEMLGPTFCADLTRFLITPRELNGVKKTIVMPESIIAVIDFLGEEQKFHEVADKWLWTLRVLTQLMMTPAIKYDMEVVKHVR
ncbi:sliding clamp loader ATPase [Vibrio phage vB_VchM_Kuja]|uniref:Sliding-clamp-loader large subunit n=1 Tax=Vibrio phage vB_VchM_Kuja TaxID=2686437 RepID=A0A6B9JHM0_9CAUD|nr:sliding clamp loader ATPase [Vibrio phage vB_VchM_Kuja]QGZ15997.1 sliding clamp loader ATPase [Vibrio phage vB_VchM_Kuja]